MRYTISVFVVVSLALGLITCPLVSGQTVSSDLNGADPRSVTIAVKAAQPRLEPPTSGPSGADAMKLARDAWKNQYEGKKPQYHTSFLNEECQPLPPPSGDSVQWTCRERMAATVRGTLYSATYDLTFSFIKEDGSWRLAGDPDFKKAKK